MSSIRPYLFMLTGCAWFSWMGILTHAIKDQTDWQIVAIARSGLAMIFAMVIASVMGVRLVILGTRVLWLRSIAGSLSMISTFYALTHMPVSDALTLTNTFPIWIALLSWPLLAERPTLGVWLAAVCAVAGVALTQQPQGGGFPLAAVSALAASLFTSIAMMGLNRLQGVPALAIVVHFSGVATLFCLASYFVFDHGNGIGNLADVGVSVRLLGVGITATIGQIFLTRAFRAGSATKVAVVGLSQVVMVMLAEVILDGRRFDLLSIVGTILVLGPTAWLMMRSRKESATSPDAPAVTLPDPPVAETDPPTVSTKI